MLYSMISSDVTDVERIPFAPSFCISGGEGLIDFGQLLARPFFWSCEKLALEVIRPKDGRVFSVFKKYIAILLFALVGIFAMPGWLVGSTLKMAGAALSGRAFMYRQGEGDERWGEEFSVLSFNACMYESGFPVILGGVAPASQRIEQVANLIRESNAEVVVLQELSLGPSEALMEEIKKEYPHFYTNVGNPGAWIQHTMVGPELFIASKAPIVSEPRFVSYAEGSRKLGFFCLETPTCWIVNAHFPEENQEAVLVEVSQEIERLKAETGKPCVLAGDLNYRKTIPENLFHDAREFTPTCPRDGEVDDFILVDRASFDEGMISVKEIGLIDCELSDHVPILAKITIQEGR
ncbi:MAG: endonuclease/exonuclease/phosphatase family protein [Parachlamydiales bacterium]|nr:endonuclease/exonuclease/phosphatase family protein [Parachlamydiales bacterium]